MSEKIGKNHSDHHSPWEGWRWGTDVAIAVLKQAAEIEQAARYDELTGLLRKEAFHEEVAARIALGKPFGVLIGDMDAFKSVNDELGHGAGDALLQRFGQYVRESVFRREHEGTAGRLGGDEFGLIVDLSKRNGKTPHQAMKLETERFERGVAEFVRQEDEAIRGLGFNMSVGGANWNPGQSDSVAELLHTADVAMYEQKGERRR